MSAFLSHKAMKFLANNFGIAPVTSPAGVRMCFLLKYPDTPGGITDPEYSANVGIQNLAASLSQAGVESRIDIERISLGLQGHNCGNVYIRWTVENDGSYSTQNATEFSELMADCLRWGGDGDKQFYRRNIPYIAEKYMGMLLSLIHI